eukprot:22931_1
MGFDIEQGIAKPSTVGLVPGYMLNQFSMDIHKGNLRVATTINENWGYLDEDEEDWGQISPSKSQVIVLEKVGQEFKEMGRVPDLGLDERIYSVRFLGDRGFVVTFRNIDPLYALNMTDPTNPFNAGELKIPGYSNYLHPVEEDYLLAISEDTDLYGSPYGLQISLFDVKDLANPIQLHKTIVDRSSKSSSQYDHHAFRYLPMSEVLILPVKNRTLDGFHLYDIDKLSGIKKYGDIVHADSTLKEHYPCYSDTYLASRSLVFQSNLMTLKGHTVIMNGNVLSPAKEWDINLDEGKNFTTCYPWFN